MCNISSEMRPSVFLDLLPHYPSPKHNGDEKTGKRQKR